MSKQFWGVVVIVILVFVGIFALGGNKANAPKGSSGSSTSATNHVEGQGKSGVKLVEYGDYQCPFCGEAFAPVKQAVADLNSQIFFQFRNFPLTELHQNAFAGARAAEAAALQGKFWEMHDSLYETQNQWSSMSDPSSFFVQLAQQLGLDTSRFKTDYASSKVNDLINADLAAGNKLNIQGTPSFFLDGKSVQLPYQQGASAIEKIIKQEITKKEAAAKH